MGLHQCLLGDVGSVVDRATDRSSQPQDGCLVPSDERAKGGIVAGAGAGDEISVRQFGWVGSHGR